MHKYSYTEVVMNTPSTTDFHSFSLSVYTFSLYHEPALPGEN